jgi:hypothetical protein
MQRVVKVITLQPYKLLLKFTVSTTVSCLLVYHSHASELVTSREINCRRFLSFCFHLSHLSLGVVADGGIDPSVPE